MLPINRPKLLKFSKNMQICDKIAHTPLTCILKEPVCGTTILNPQPQLLHVHFVPLTLSHFLEQLFAIIFEHFISL